MAAQSPEVARLTAAQPEGQPLQRREVGDESSAPRKKRWSRGGAIACTSARFFASAGACSPRPGQPTVKVHTGVPDQGGGVAPEEVDRLGLPLPG